MIFTIPNSAGFREMNDCHAPDSGQFCSGPGSAARRVRHGRRVGGEGYSLVFRSGLNKMPGGAAYPGITNNRIARLLTPDEVSKARTAKVYLLFDSNFSAGLGAPIRWTAPNGVTVVYDRGQRRGDADDTGRSSTGVYHDFSFGDEKVVPLTRNIGPGRRALRAWAKAFMAPKITTRFQARQMVRPGD